MFLGINILAVCVVALLAVAIGSVWYSPLLFGKIWVRSLGIANADVDFSKKEMVGVTARAVLIQIFFFSIVRWMSISLTYSSLCLFILAVLGMIVFHLGLIALWEKRPLSYVFVHAGYTALILFGGLTVMIYWPW